MYKQTEPKFSFSATDIVGMIFAPLGLFFALLGLMLRGADRLFLLIFGGMGLIFLLTGTAMLLFGWQKRKLLRRIVAEGHFITATVTSVQPNYNVRVNGRCPYFAECCFTDPVTGAIHLFRSQNIYFDPTSLLLDASVRVYCKDGDYRHYYVDVNSLLPEIKKH